MVKHLWIPVILIASILGSCKDMGSNVPPVPITPAIRSIQPDSAAIGDTVTISGTNFGSTQGSSSVVFSPGVAATIILAWSDSSIKAKVPSGAVTGNVSVSINGSSSNGFQFKTSIAVDTLVHFQSGVLPILINNCALPSCHSGSFPTSGFNASTYDNLRKGGSTFGTNVVIPFDSTDSDIMKMIRSKNNPIGLLMPQSGPYAATGLPDSLIVRIGTWIEQGALNN
jgi:hypothetical protein